MEFYENEETKEIYLIASQKELSEAYKRLEAIFAKTNFYWNWRGRLVVAVELPEFYFGIGGSFQHIDIGLGFITFTIYFRQ